MTRFTDRPTTQHEAQDRSYTVRDRIPAGEWVLCQRPTDQYPIRVFIDRYSNAGFRGIEAWVETATGSRFNVSAGWLYPLDNAGRM